MRYTVYVLSLALVVASALALWPLRAVPVASAHKYHTSFTEAEYNAREKSLEITLRTFPDDLENILSRRKGRGVRLDRKAEFEPLLIAYLEETFQLRNARGEAVKLSWVGMEARADSAWLYFEARLPEGLAGAELRNRFLCDLFADQINLVNVKHEERKRALTFKNGDGFKTLAPPPPREQ